MAEENEELKHIVRILNTDLNGHQPVQMALTGINGMGDGMPGFSPRRQRSNPPRPLGCSRTRPYPGLGR